MFQGKGIGQKLLQVAKEEQDILSLAVYRENQAVRLLSKQGFVQQKRTIDETGNEECHLVWQAQ